MTTEPTDKAPEVENILKSLFGFDRRESITSLRCVPKPVGCDKLLTETRFAESTGGDGVFRDELSAKEYRITGMCQDCQDAFQARMEAEDGC